ncbi:MAG: hypothetical protein QNK32_00655 [Porticoccus sp.]|nr:hypothetical protein [Porticoccus sp.]
MHILKKAITAVALMFLVTDQIYAFDFGAITKSVVERVVVDTAVDTAVDAVADGLTDDDAEQGDVRVTPQELASAGPIVEAPLPVILETFRGSADVFSDRPKIAIAGYNIGAYQTAKVSESTSRGQGASVSMSFRLEGVDTSMLQRIADAAHADLVSQLQAAGIDVIDASALFAASEANEIKRSSKPVEDKKSGRTSVKLVVVGPSDIGVVSSFGLIPKGFNGNVGDQASAALDAIVIYPNVALDFVWTAGGGKKMLQKRVSVEGGARFALDEISDCTAVYSKDGRFVDGSVELRPAEDVGVDDVFASVDEAGSKDNSTSVGISNAIGFAMGSRKGTEYLVTVDPKRYESLAMNATKGFNTALVQQIKSAKGI